MVVFFSPLAVLAVLAWFVCVLGSCCSFLGVCFLACNVLFDAIIIVSVRCLCLVFIFVCVYVWRCVFRCVLFLLCV